MDSGTAAILGTTIGGVIGLVGTFGSAILKHFLDTKRSNALDHIRRDRLKQLLSSQKFTWRSMANLSSAIGADEETTAALLLEIEARKSMAAGKDTWALVSRAPFPDDPQPS